MSTFLKASQLRDFVLASLVSVSILAVSNQVYSQDFGFHTSIEVTGPDGDGGLIPDFDMFAFSAGTGFPGGFGIAEDGGITTYTTLVGAPGGSMTLAPNGVGIGFGLLSGSGNRLAQFPLHIVGGGTGDAYGAAEILVQNRNTIASVRRVLGLQNNGGTSVEFTDTSTGGSSFALVNAFNRLDVFNNTTTPIRPFSIRNSAPNNAFTLNSSGLGLGTTAPTSKLHLFSDGTDPNDLQGDLNSVAVETTSAAGTKNRTMMNLKNSGGAFMTLEDSSQPTRSVWFFSNNNDELLITKGFDGLQNVAPGMRFLPNGQIFFRANQRATFTVFPNGNVQPGLSGVYLQSSDRNLKENIQAINSGEILAKLVKIPISSWNYIDDEAKTPHVGPMAQDFYASFKLGNDHKTISTIDEQGIALAGIQGLNAKVETKHQQLTDTIANQSKTIEQQSEMIEKLTARLDRLEEVVAHQNDLSIISAVDND